MNGNQSGPPKAALWIMRHFGLSGLNETLIGDLVEQFAECRSSRWFWNQVWIAVAYRALALFRQYWPLLCYAFTGASIVALRSRTNDGPVSAVEWWNLPWPWSMFLFDLSRPTALLSLIALPVLAAALRINQSFRLLSVLRTLILHLILLTFG